MSDYQHHRPWMGGGSSVGPLPVLTKSDKHFLINGRVTRIRGFSAFPLIDRVLRNTHDWQNWTEAWVERNYNYARVWPYVPRQHWGDSAWDLPPLDEAKDVLRMLGERFGLVCEVTLSTDARPDGYEIVESWSNELKSLTNLLFEGINEPDYLEKLDTMRVSDILQRTLGTRYLWTNGSGDPAKIRGTYGVAHDPRGGKEWARYPKWQQERWVGGGPYAQSDPAFPIPWLSDEPGKIEDNGTNMRWWRGFYGLCSTMEAGGLVHIKAGKFLDPLTPDEATLRDVAADAMAFFPDDMFNGSYAHGDAQKADEQAHGCLRTYDVRNGRVRVCPTDNSEILLYV